MSLAKERMAVTLITGFLGAGKTTWLNAQLRSGHIPDGSLILVNDFGRLQVDADLIAARDDQIIRLANGCVCCVLGDNLAAQLSQVAQRTPRPQAIYVEGSGIARAAQLQQAVHIHPHLQLRETVCLVDAGQAQRWSADAQTQGLWQAQIRAASRVIVNRMQGAALHPFLHALLQELAQQGRTQVEYEQPPARLPSSTSASFTQASAHAGAWADRSRPSPCGPGQWTSASLVHDGQVDAQLLQATLNTHGQALHRAKGWVRCLPHARMQLLQYTPGQPRWVPAHAMAAQRRSQLLCIGTAGEGFRQCLDALSLLGFVPMEAMDTSP